MSIEVSKFRNIQVACKNTLRKLNELAREDNLPDAWKLNIQTLIKSLETYDMEPHRDIITEPKGDMLTRSELKKLLVSESGFNKWKNFDYTVEYEEEHVVLSSDDLFDTFGIHISEDSINTFSFSRSCNNRNDIWLITFVCIPGYTYIEYDTGRVNIGADVLIKNDELKEALDELFSS